MDRAMRRHCVLNKSRICVITNMKTRSLNGSVKVSAKSETKYSCVIAAIGLSKRWEGTFVHGWKAATKPLAASCTGGILRIRTRRRHNNRR